MHPHATAALVAILASVPALALPTRPGRLKKPDISDAIKFDASLFHIAKPPSIGHHSARHPDEVLLDTSDHSNELIIPFPLPSPIPELDPANHDVSPIKAGPPLSKRGWIHDFFHMTPDPSSEYAKSRAAVDGPIQAADEKKKAKEEAEKKEKFEAFKEDMWREQELQKEEREHQRAKEAKMQVMWENYVKGKKEEKEKAEEERKKAEEERKKVEEERKKTEEERKKVEEERKKVEEERKGVGKKVEITETNTEVKKTEEERNKNMRSAKKVEKRDDDRNKHYTVKNPDGSVTEYDGLDRPVKLKVPYHKKEKWQYDDMGNVVKHKSADGKDKVNGNTIKRKPTKGGKDKTKMDDGQLKKHKGEHDLKEKNKDEDHAKYKGMGMKAKEKDGEDTMKWKGKGKTPGKVKMDHGTVTKEHMDEAKIDEAQARRGGKYEEPRVHINGPPFGDSNVNPGVVVERDLENKGPVTADTNKETNPQPLADLPGLPILFPPLPLPEDSTPLENKGPVTADTNKETNPQPLADLPGLPILFPPLPLPEDSTPLENKGPVTADTNKETNPQPLADLPGLPILFPPLPLPEDSTPLENKGPVTADTNKETNPQPLADLPGLPIIFPPLPLPEDPTPLENKGPVTADTNKETNPQPLADLPGLPIIFPPVMFPEDPTPLPTPPVPHIERDPDTTSYILNPALDPIPDPENPIPHPSVDPPPTLSGRDVAWHTKFPNGDTIWYDKQHRIIKKKTRGGTEKWSYDNQGYIKKYKGPHHVKEKYEYDAAGYVVRFKKAGKDGLKESLKDGRYKSNDPNKNDGNEGRKYRTEESKNDKEVDASSWGQRSPHRKEDEAEHGEVV